MEENLFLQSYPYELGLIPVTSFFKSAHFCSCKINKTEIEKGVLVPENSCRD